MNEVNNFLPAWTGRWTKEESEEELNNFQFKGPSWYIMKENTILVLPTGRSDVFWFHVYTYNPSDIFNAIVNSPVQVDER